MNNVCQGGAIDCAIYDNAAAHCTSIIGCSFDFTTASCGGSATCAGQGPSCNTQGCTFVAACTGTVTPCEQISPADCTNTDGCVVQ